MLGPILFAMYTLPKVILQDTMVLCIISMCTTHNCMLLSISGRILVSVQLQSVSQCIDDIQMWMCLNMLNHNDDKIEVLLIGSNNPLNHLSLQANVQLFC